MDEKVEAWIEILRDNSNLHSRQIKALQDEMRELKELLQIKTEQKILD